MPIPHRIRSITNWVPYYDVSRKKQMWHINKSGSTFMIVQFKAFLEITIRKNLENKSWTSAKEVMKREMSLLGAAAPRISDSRIGTLKSDLYQTGLIQYVKDGYIITKAGRDFLINPSDILFNQFIKFQYTNPTILDYCKDIYVFPNIGIIRLLLDKEIAYLTKEELSYIVFLNYLYEDDFDDVLNRIKNFRKLSNTEKNRILSEFKITPEGHVALAKASTAMYLMSRLAVTDYFKIEKLNNTNKLVLNYTKIDELKNILTLYNDITPFPYSKKIGFENDLWFEYIGNPEKKFPPQLKEITLLKSNSECIINIIRNKKIEGNYHVPNNTTLSHAFFNNEHYQIEVYIPSILKTYKFDITTIKNEDIFIDLEKMNILEVDSQYYLDLTRELINSRTFDSELANKIKYIEKKFSKSDFNVGSIRGARFEELLFKILQDNAEEYEIQEVIWKGKIDEFGIPHQTPGGPKGDPDIIVVLKDRILIFELTTISSRSGQENSESLNIVRHVRNFSENNIELFEKYELEPENIELYFSAPVLHSDLVKSLSDLLDLDKIKYNFIKTGDLLDMIENNELLNIQTR